MGDYKLYHSAYWQWSATHVISRYVCYIAVFSTELIHVQDGILYLLHELASLLTSQKIPSNDEMSSPFISRSLTTPAGVNTTNYGAAEIQIPPATPEFPERFIYTSNRQIGGIEDPLGKCSTLRYMPLIEIGRAHV